MKRNSYFLGCPVWACESWKGSIFAPSARRKEWLHQYSLRFNTVEGNTSFYALPPIETVRKWAAETVDGFRFCLKFPRTMSHDRRLAGCQWDLEQFLDRLAILDDADRLGPSFLQLPPDFGSPEFFTLQAFLRELPRELPFAIEVRHPEFFQSPLESELNGLLEELGMERVNFDSRALFHFPPADLTETGARRRKPRIPPRRFALGQRPFLRLIGVNRVDRLTPWIEEWAARVAEWIQQGRTPFVFTHSPNDRYAPDFAAAFHQAVRRHLPDLPDLPSLDVETPTQLELFP